MAAEPKKPSPSRTRQENSRDMKPAVPASIPDTPVFIRRLATTVQAIITRKDSATFILMLARVFLQHQ